MKRILLYIIFILMPAFLMAQAPQSFKYQAVIRYSDGSIVQNQMVSLRISLLPDSPQGTADYAEIHDVTTNQFGIANINIGEGNPQTGTFNSIAWGEHTYFIQTELDITGNDDYEFIGTSRLQSVPYALYAANAVNVDDDDPDPTNEIQIIDLSGNILTLSNGGQVDLSGYLDNTDEQDLSLSGNMLYISNGQNVDLTPYLDNTDEQEINLTGTDLSISNGNSIPLDTLMDNTDEQNLNLDGTTLSITSGNSVELGGEVDLDADPTNELQVLSISNDTIFLTDGEFVVLPAGFDGQYNSLTGAPEKISDLEMDASGLKIFNLQNPAEPQDAATKAYVDNFINLLEENGIINYVDFSSNTQYIAVDSSVQFYDESEINSTQWLWNFGDSTISEIENPIHSYESPGVYDIKLNVSDDFISFEETKEDYINVGYMPIAAFTADSYNAPVNVEIQFNDSSENNPQSWQWDFGDGNTSYNQHPSYIYTTPGEYDVSLTVSNNFGFDVTSHSLTIGEPPEAYFELGRYYYHLGEQISFVDQSTNDPMNWQWEFGDGNTEYADSVSYIYPSSGSYNVTLTATNDYGSTEYSKTVVICDTVTTDIDGNNYNTIIIGDQCWLASDLEVTHYPDGSSIPNADTESEWESLYAISDAYCFNHAPYGNYYTWAAATTNSSSNENPSGVQGICPDGWHVPSKLEWIELANFIESQGYIDSVGNVLKSDEYWTPSGVDLFGFKALPNGRRDYPGGTFMGQVVTGIWWCSNVYETDTDYSETFKLFNDFNGYAISQHHKASGIAVRCVKN